MLMWPLKFYSRDRAGTVSCPDCGQVADPNFGDHGGDCIGPFPAEHPRSTLSVSAVELIRRHALTHRFVSINELRPVFDAAGIPPASRGPAFGAACKAGHIRPGDFLPSTGESAKGHNIRIYVSLICSSVPAGAL
jgi:hypothetical protein